MSKRPTIPPPSPNEPPRAPRNRIETQIHRRRKVKATPPFEAEWDDQSGLKPEGLRTPPDKMDRTKR